MVESFDDNSVVVVPNNWIIEEEKMSLVNQIQGRIAYPCSLRCRSSFKRVCGIICYGYA